MYLVHGKGQKRRYVYVSKETIRKLKSNHWKPNKTNRISFYHFLQKTKKELNISKNVELTPHTLRRCFTTHNALNGVPIPILQKALGHKNIRTTSYYWKGSVDIRNFADWLELDSGPKEPERILDAKTDDNPKLLKTPQISLKLENPGLDNTKEPELLKVIEKLKEELAEKDLIIAEKNKQLQSKDNEISLLTNENQKLKAINQEKDGQLLSFAETLNKKDKKLKELQEKVKKITEQNIPLIQNSTNLKNTAKKPIKNQVSNNQIETKPPQEKNIRKILFNSRESSKEPKNNSLVVKEKPQTELIAEIQVWKPPN